MTNKLDKKQFKEYEKMLMACDYLVDLINNDLESKNIKVRIKNTILESTGRFNRFIFEAENLPKDKTMIDLLSNIYDMQNEEK